MVQLNTPWRAVAAAFALNGVLLGSWAGRIPAFVDRLGLDERGLGILLLFMGGGALLSFPLAGRLSDHFGAALVTRWLAVVYLLSILLVGLSWSPLALTVALFVFGMCHGAMDVTMNSWGSEVERHLGRSVMSSFHAMWSLGAGLGAAGGYVATTAGLGVALHFCLAALITGGVLGPFLRLPWVSPIRRAQGGGQMFSLPRGALVLVGLIAMAAGLGEGAAVDWSAVFLRDVLGAADSRATLGYAAFSMTMVAMRLTIDRVILRIGPVRVARIGGALAAVGYGLCALTTQLSLAVLGFVLIGMGLAAVTPMAFSRAANDPQIPPGQAIASVATLGYGAMLLGPPAIGFIAQLTSLRVSFGLVGCCAMLAAALAGALRPGASGMR
ncbi:MFS transporter [Citreicella sp. C3M06]|uniref:MFS transporter n=1 Tax=Citreicella sp. C3M06 TaxID=2841564 RepID=UPI001C0A4C66|nr:MFS transporter [Citreicella sp. C3M06]MBU2963574.1 MFS transporter [Citreicella sp. C3M06]